MFLHSQFLYFIFMRGGFSFCFWFMRLSNFSYFLNFSFDFIFRRVKSFLFNDFKYNHNFPHWMDKEPCRIWVPKRKYWNVYHCEGFGESINQPVPCYSEKRLSRTSCMLYAFWGWVQMPPRKIYRALKKNSNFFISIKWAFISLSTVKFM